MECFGFREQEHPGVICRQIMVDEKTPTGVFAVGEIRVFGKNCWKHCQKNQS